MPMTGDRTPLLERFQTKYRVDGNGCWIWTSASWANGAGNHYPVIWIGDGKTEYAHRVSYREFVGDIPDGMCVCHKCDTPLCVNPEHLFVGTHRDNAQDAILKGRRVNKRKYDHDEILIMLNEGIRHTEIMAKTGISRTQLKRIVRDNRRYRRKTTEQEETG